MIRLSCGRLAVGLVLLLAAGALAHLNLGLPEAAIDYNAGQAAAIHGSAEAWSSTQPVWLTDITRRDAARWLSRTVTTISTVRGYAHCGGGVVSGTPQDQYSADQLVAHIQIWGWRDDNGNGQADGGDSTAAWTKLIEHLPSSNPQPPAAPTSGHVVGWNIPWPYEIPTSTWRGDLLQGQTLTFQPGQSWLLLIRVVDASGNTNLMHQLEGSEHWDDGAINGIGSDVASDRYVDCDGNTPGTADAKIPDKAVVWMYVPRMR